jgi:hypothetical protein
MCRVVSSFLLLFRIAVHQEILIPVSPGYEVEKGAAFDAAAHVRLRGISGISCTLRYSGGFSDTRLVLIVLLLPCRFRR